MCASIFWESGANTMGTTPRRDAEELAKEAKGAMDSPASGSEMKKAYSDGAVESFRRVVPSPRL